MFSAAYGNINGERPMTTAQLETKKLNLGAVVLAIVKAKGESGAFTDDITRSILALKDKIPVESIPIRPGPTGPDSDRIRSLVGVFRVRGFLKEDSPARLTQEGVSWLKAQLEQHFKDSRELETFTRLVSSVT